MSATRLYMSMSLDGFIAGPNDDGPGNGLGDDGLRLHEWLSDRGPEDRHEDTSAGGVPLGPSGVNGQVHGELMSTGAVVVGRRSFEMAGEWGGDHHDGAPIFVLTRRAGDPPQHQLVTYVEDVADAMASAKAAAGGRDVAVHGARVAQLALAARVLDELEVHLIPVLLGTGRRLFDGLGAEHIELALTRMIDGPGVTHLRYRVER